MTEKLRKIRKVSAFRHCDISFVVDEVTELKEQLAQGDRTLLSPYNLHQACVDGTKYIAADARFLNRHAGSRGRGNFRYLFDAEGYVGVAEHTQHNKYRRVA